jgi:LysM repeat protein
MGKQEEAENYFKQARQINKETFDPKYTTNRLNLEHSALLYINQNRLDEAEELLLELLEIQFNLLDDLEPDSLKYLHQIASEYFNKGFYDQAEELSLKINQLYKKFQLTNSIEYCESLNFLATSYTRVNKLEDSIRLSTEAIAIGEKLFYESKIDRNSYTSSSLTIIESYTNLGIALWNVAQKFNQPPQLNQRINFLLEAEIYTRQSLELCQLIFERTNDKTVQYRESHIHNNFGLILEDLEKY